MDVESIEIKLLEIVEEFKIGKDVSSQLIEVRSGGNYYAFQEYIVNSHFHNDMYFYLDIRDIPIPEGDGWYNYYTDEELDTQNIEKKIKNLRLDELVNWDTGDSFHLFEINGVCLTCKCSMEGKGSHIYDLQIYENREEAITIEKNKGEFLYHEGMCLTHDMNELVTIWDRFVNEVKNGLHE